MVAVTGLLRQPEGNVAGEVLLLRRRRDRRVDLHLLKADGARGARVRGSLADYDALVDGLIAASDGTGKGTDVTTLADVHELFAARATRTAQQQRSWLLMWAGGAFLGLAALVMAFWSTSQSGPRTWSWTMISVATVAALLASFYILRAAPNRSALRWFGLAACPWGSWGWRWSSSSPMGDGWSRRRWWPSPRRSSWCRRSSGPTERLDIEGRSSRSSGFLHLMGRTTSEGSTQAWSHLLVADELENLRRRIHQEARAQRRASLAWATTFIIVGGLAALLSGAAGVTANQTDATDWVAALAIGGAGLTALMTAVNPGRRWEQARTLQKACESLEQEVGVVIRLDLTPSADHETARQRIEDIAIMYDSLLGLPDRPRIKRM